MGHHIFEWGPRTLVMHDGDMELVRHFLCTAANDLGLNEVSVAIAGWEWLGPGVWINIDERVLVGRLEMFDLALARIRSFGDEIPLEYLRSVRVGEGCSFLRPRPTADLLKTVASLSAFVETPEATRGPDECARRSLAPCAARPGREPDRALPRFAWSGHGGSSPSRCADRCSVLPTSLLLGGTIERRQTSFWDLRSSDGSLHRAHFHSKLETRFDRPTFAQAALVDSHVLLFDHQEPVEALYISSPSSTPDAILDRLRHVVATHFHGWRTLDRYLNPDVDAADLLRGGYGMLMRGPASLADRARALLEEFGVRVDASEPRAPPRDAPIALILGASFVVAHRFQFAPTESPAR